ncbi:MAG: AIR synthase family protein [Dehalococcoidia bacterium]|nr:AIR synthase family protein [Dehalococcoidia bacterium]
MENSADQLKVGKIPARILEHLLGQIDINDDRVLLGPMIGEDAAVIDLGDTVLVAKTDPVTFVSDQVGWYAVHINANDIACVGATPRWFLATLLVPEGSTEAGVSEIFRQLTEACEFMNIQLVGGHSEVTAAVTQPVVVGAMLGEAQKESIIRTSGAMDGDSIVLTKGIAVEGSAVLARDAEARLLQAGVGPATVARAKEFLLDPGISIVKDAQIARAAVEVHCLHDPTEGGVVTGLWEIAKAANLGLSVEEGSIPVLLETAEICEALGLDPLGLLASGALLITLPPEDVPPLFKALESEGIEAFEIGRMMEAEEGVTIIRAHELEALPTFERDELARFFYDQPKRNG